jgi:acyl-CoA thioesterase-2
VTARQKGEQIFHMECSFHADEPAMLEHQAQPPKDVAQPEDLPNLRQIAETLGDDMRYDFARHLSAFRHLEVRPLDAPAWLEGRETLDGRGCWIRLLPDVGDDPLMHACGLAYLSDFWLAGTAAAGQPSTAIFGKARVASIDHAMWFHRPGRPDDWLLYETDSPSAQAGRGLARGQLFTRAGLLAASTCQEALFRRRR